MPTGRDAKVGIMLNNCIQNFVALLPAELRQCVSQFRMLEGQDGDRIESGIA